MNEPSFEFDVGGNTSHIIEISLHELLLIFVGLTRDKMNDLVIKYKC